MSRELVEILTAPLLELAQLGDGVLDVPQPLVEVGPAPAVVTVVPSGEVADGCDVRLEGPAVAVYLTLWNRSDELDPVDLWRSAPVTWG